MYRNIKPTKTQTLIDQHIHYTGSFILFCKWSSFRSDASNTIQYNAVLSYTPYVAYSQTIRRRCLPTCEVIAEYLQTLQWTHANYMVCGLLLAAFTNSLTGKAHLIRSALLTYLTLTLQIIKLLNNVK